MKQTRWLSEFSSLSEYTRLYPKSFCFSKEEERKDIQTDTVHKWVVFASSFFMMVLVNGFVYSFGTLFPAILEAYKENRATTAAIQSIFTAIGLSSGKN